MYTPNVADRINGVETQKKKIARTPKNPTFFIYLSSYVLALSSRLKKYFSHALTLINLI
jgi:hypothetical protein